MSNIFFPTDPQPRPPALKKNRHPDPVQHADAVTTDPDKNKQQSGQQHEPHGENEQTQNQAALSEESKTSAESHHPTAHSVTTPDKRAINRDQRQHVSRRQVDRRQQNQAVLLDTRSGQDRRKNAGQRKDDSEQNNTAFGIDTRA